MKSLKNLKDRLQETFDLIFHPGRPIEPYKPPPADQINWAPIEQAIGINQPTSSPSPVPTNSPTPSPVPSSMPMASPMPTLLPEITNKWGDSPPYQNEVKSVWGDLANQAMNIAFKESSLDPKKYHINSPLWQGGNATTPEAWKDLRNMYPSIDTGLFQLNTATAMTDYLQGKGWTYYDTMTDPMKNIQAAYDLYAGNIPYTAPGWNNWVANKGLGY